MAPKHQNMFCFIFLIFVSLFVFSGLVTGTLPYSEDFEALLTDTITSSGLLPNLTGWSYQNVNGSGRLSTSVISPHSGSRCIYLDCTDCLNYSLNLLTWNIDMTNVSVSTHDIFLSFFTFNNWDDVHLADGVWARNSSSSDWIHLLPFDESIPKRSWFLLEVDVSAALRAARSDFGGPHFTILFSQYDNGQAPNDGRGFDDILLFEEHDTTSPPTSRVATTSAATSTVVTTSAATSRAVTTSTASSTVVTSVATSRAVMTTATSQGGTITMTPSSATQSTATTASSTSSNDFLSSVSSSSTPEPPPCFVGKYTEGSAQFTLESGLFFQKASRMRAGTSFVTTLGFFVHSLGAPIVEGRMALYSNAMAEYPETKIVESDAILLSSGGRHETKSKWVVPFNGNRSIWLGVQFNESVNIAVSSEQYSVIARDPLHPYSEGFPSNASFQDTQLWYSFSLYFLCSPNPEVTSTLSQTISHHPTLSSANPTFTPVSSLHTSAQTNRVSETSAGNSPITDTSDGANNSVSWMILGYLAIIVPASLIVCAVIGGIAAFACFKSRQPRFVDSSELSELQANCTDYSSIETAYSSLPALPTSLPASKSRREYAELPDKHKLELMKANHQIKYEELELQNKIGEGEFGVVYRAVWRRAPVACKILKKTQSGMDPEKVHEFQQEAKLHKSLPPHENVVQFLAICSDFETPCIVVEFVHQGSLVSYLQHHGSLISDTQMLFTVALGIAQGMCHLHDNNVLHRDLACRNVLLAADNSPKVTDFGMSRLLVEATPYITSSNMLPLRWISPETIQDRGFTPKTDIWSFGVCLLEMLTAETPYGEDLSSMEVAQKVGYEGLVPQAPENTPAMYRKIMESTSQQCPQDRPSFDDIVSLIMINHE